MVEILIRCLQKPGSFLDIGVSPLHLPIYPPSSCQTLGRLKDNKQTPVKEDILKLFSKKISQFLIQGNKNVLV